MILTPEQIERLFADPRGPKTVPPMSEYIRILNTLAAYVSVVWNVARGSWLVVDDEGAYCVHCDEEAWIDEIVDYIRKYACNHAPGCPYAQARKLLGLD